jgi:hypothetical protein
MKCNITVITGWILESNKKDPRQVGSTYNSYDMIRSVQSLVIPLMAAPDTFVKDRHGLVCRSNLNLHKVGLVVVAHGTAGLGPIHVFPCGRPTQNVIDGLAFQHGPRGHSPFGNGTAVRAGGAKEMSRGFQVSAADFVTDLEQGAIQWAEPHGCVATVLSVCLLLLVYCCCTPKTVNRIVSMIDCLFCTISRCQ